MSDEAGRPTSQILGSSDFIAALASKLQEIDDTGLFAVSMDHSPSEQLGDVEHHTTVLIMSSRMAHEELANRVAARLRPSLGTLKKWSKANETYRRNFLPVLFEEWRAISDVQVFAQSATEDAIHGTREQCLNELNLRNIYAPIPEGSATPRVQIGPVYKQSAPTTPITFSLARNRADMCIFVGHFVRRVQQAMFFALNLHGSTPPTAFNWNFFADRFPGGINGNMDLFFRVILQSGPRFGRTTWGFYLEGDDQPTDLLADNLAGALDSIASHPSRLPKLDAPSRGSVFSWERLS